MAQKAISKEIHFPNLLTLWRSPRCPVFEGTAGLRTYNALKIGQEKLFFNVCIET